MKYNIVNGKKIFQKDKSLNNCLTNCSNSRLTRCDECTIRLYGSNWHNIIVFYSFSEYTDRDFLCVRCAVEPTKFFKIPPVTTKTLDRFVRKIKREYDFDPSPLRQRKPNYDAGKWRSECSGIEKVKEKIKCLAK